MSGSEAGNDCSCVRETISVSDRVEDLVQFRCSVFVLFVQLGVSIQSRYNQQRRMCCVSFQKPSDEEKFLPREISRELMLFGAIVINAIFFYAPCLYGSCWLTLALVIVTYSQPFSVDLLYL